MHTRELRFPSLSLSLPLQSTFSLQIKYVDTTKTAEDTIPAPSLLTLLPDFNDYPTSSSFLYYNLAVSHLDNLPLHRFCCHCSCCTPKTPALALNALCLSIWLMDWHSAWSPPHDWFLLFRGCKIHDHHLAKLDKHAHDGISLGCLGSSRKTIINLGAHSDQVKDNNNNNN